MTYMIFLPAILLLGVFTTYEDIKEGRIRNIHIILAFAMSFAIHSALVILGFITLADALRALIHTVLVLAIGIVIWLVGYWGAGDAKLIAAFTALIPPEVYGRTLSQFPPLDFMINTIIPIFAYLLILSLIRTTAKQKLKVLKSSLNPKVLGMSLLIIFSLAWIIREAFVRMHIQENYFLYIILIAGLYKVILAWLEEQAIFFLVFLSVMRLFLNTQYLISKNFIISFFMILTGYLILMQFISQLGTYFTKNVNIHRLEPGMVLTKAITRDGMKIGLDLVPEQDILISPKTKGITQEEIKELRKRHIIGKIHFNQVEVMQTVPFAGFIFLGFILFMIFNVDIISALSMFL